METKEFNFKGFKTSGFLMIFLEIVLLAAVVWLFLQGIWGIIASITLFLFWLVFLFGFTKLEPNEAVVMIFFGK